MVIIIIQQRNRVDFKRLLDILARILCDLWRNTNIR